jgi:PAS domain S-box-containing protein
VNENFSIKLGGDTRKDIPERNAAEMASTQLAAIVEFSEDAIISKDLNSIVISWNNSAEKIFGYTSSEMVGTSIMRLIPADRQDEENHILWKIKRGESVEHFETRRQAKDGRLIDVSITASPIKDDTGTVVGVSKVARDISERKRVENGLQESMRFAQSTIDALSAHVCVLDETGAILATNEAWRQFAKANPPLGPAQAGDNYLEVCDAAAASGDGDAAAFAAGIRAVMRGQRMEFEMEYACHSPSERRWFAGRVTRFPGETAVRVVVAHENITARKLAEAMLLERKEQLRLYVEHSPAAIAMFDPDMKYLVASRRWMESYRMAGHSIIGRSHYEVFPEIPQRWKEIHQRCLAGAVEKSDEEPFPRVDGTTDWIRWEIRPWHRADGSIGGIIIFSEDITERKLAEELVRQSEARYHTLFDSLIEGFCTIEMIFDAAGKPVDYRFLEINPAFEKQTGLQNVQGKLMRDLAPDHEAHWFEIYGKIALTGEPAHFENQAIALGRHYDVCAYRVGGPESRKVAILFNDISERKRAENELRWKTAFLEAQVDSALDGILVVDEHSKVILQNQRLAQIFKIPDDLTCGNEDIKILQYVTHQMKNPKQFIERVTHLYEHPDEIGRDEIELAKGTILDRYSAPVRDKAGKYYGRIWTFRDITDQRKLESQFRQVQKMESIGQLAGGVAHDFNNILAVIEMQSGLLKSSGGLSADQVEFADEISATVQRAAALTRQLLLFSHREVFQPRDLDLNESSVNTTKMLKRIVGENIEIEIKTAAQPMFIHADAGMMDQVLMNLVVNARDAMPNGGQLHIEISGVEFDDFSASQSVQVRPGSFVCLRVSDSGSGIPPEVLPRIFEPFFTTKGVGKGTGLGLATVFGIVQQHQGWINVYSEAGHGTTFRIYLPRLARNAGSKSSQPALADMRGGNETILLAEDEPAMRLSVRKALSQLGYRILEAPTGVKALEVWRQNRDEIRLLLTDLVMPDGMTGKDLASSLLQENPKLKVIYMSGYSAEVIGKEFPLKEGVNFLAKPFQAYKLAQTIRDCLDKI